MIGRIAYFQLAGISVQIWSGILALLGFIFTASISTVLRGKISFKWHSRVAKASLVLAVFHGLLGLFARYL